MKRAAQIARILLGVIFVVFGLNGFLQFIPAPPPTGLPAQFLGVLVASHFTALIFGVQLLGGLLLLVNRYVPLAMILLGPEIVCILFFHASMAPSGLGLALVVTVLWVIVARENKHHLAGIFAKYT